MSTLYLACLIFGGIFIVISLAFGSDADAEADVDVDVDSDVGDAEAADVNVTGDTVEAVKFLSFRNVIFFLSFFGLTGTLLTWLGTNSLLTFVSALLFGAAAGMLMHQVMRRLATSEVGETLNLERLVGAPAKVAITVNKNQRGKIVLITRGQRIQVLALTAEEAARDEFSVGETVFILHLEDGVAYVVEEEFISAPMRSTSTKDIP